MLLLLACLLVVVMERGCNPSTKRFAPLRCLRWTGLLGHVWQKRRSMEGVGDELDNR